MLKLLVVRHGIAMEREDFSSTGQSDDSRPLTKKGETEMRAVARGLRAIIPRVDRLASSSLTRALQTAAILAEAFGLKPVTTDSLRPEARYESFIGWCGSAQSGAVLAAVGHDPHLSGLVSWLLAGSDHPFIELKKGAACLLAFEGAPAKSSGTLVWSLAPAQLHRLES